MRLLTAVVVLVLVAPAWGQKKTQGGEQAQAQRFAKTAKKYGDLHVTVSGFNGFSGTQEFVTLTFTLAHTDDTRRVVFRGWAGSAVKLSDDLGNVYQPISSKAPGQVSGTITVYSDRTQNDALRFEKPVPKASVLTLDLPGENVGFKGTIRFVLRKAPGSGVWTPEEELPRKP